MTITSDPTDPRIKRGQAGEAGPQNEVYLVLSDEERAKGFVRKLHRSYIHDTCGTETTMALALCETYARDPNFYGATYCVCCGGHYPVAEFKWPDGTAVGS